MLPIQLKTKEFYLIANSLFNDPSSQVFSLLDRIKSATEGKQDNDLTIVNATNQEIEIVYRKLTMSPEGIYNESNASMFSQLNAQVQQGISDNDQEWIDLGFTLNQIRTRNLAAAEEIMAYAKSKLA